MCLFMNLYYRDVIWYYVIISTWVYNIYLFFHFHTNETSGWNCLWPLKWPTICDPKPPTRWTFIHDLGDSGEKGNRYSCSVPWNLLFLLFSNPAFKHFVIKSVVNLIFWDIPGVSIFGHDTKRLYLQRFCDVQDDKMKMLKVWCRFVVMKTATSRLTKWILYICFFFCVCVGLGEWEWLVHP